MKQHLRTIVLLLSYVGSTWGILWAAGVFEPQRADKVAMRDMMREYYRYTCEPVEVEVGMIFNVTRTRSVDWFKPGMSIERQDTLHVHTLNIDNAVDAININIRNTDRSRIQSLREAGWEGAARYAERYLDLKPVTAADFQRFIMQTQMREEPSFEGFRMWLNRF